MMSQQRQQMQRVEQQLQDVKQDVKQELQQTRQESRQQLQDVKQELMQELQQTRQELASLKEKSTAAERPTLEPASIPVTHRAARSPSAAYATKPSRIPIPRRVLSGQRTTSQVTPLSAATAKACSRVQPIAKKMPKTLLHSLANPNGTEYRLHVLSPFNSLLPAQAVFIFVTISLSLESQRRFEGSLRASHSYMKFDPSKGRLVKFSRGGRAHFHIRVLNFAPFEIEAKEGIEEITKEEVEELPPSDHFIRYQVIPLQENVSTQRVRLALTANGIEGVTPPDVKLKAIPVTIQFNIPPQPTVSQQAGDRAENKRETDDNLRTISREIAPEVGNKWYKVGRELGLSEDELRTLQHKHLTERFYCMLKKRAKQGNLHWRMLYDALRSDTVQQYEAADKLQLLLNI